MKGFRAVLALLALFVGADASSSDLECRLKRESIASSINFRAYLKKKGIATQMSHSIQFITLESGLRAIFKKGNYHYAEVAAYRASKALGLDLVPPTVFRTIDGIQGSLQLYIDALDLACSNRKELLAKVGPKAVSDMKLFYYIFGQWDTHPGNQIVAHSDDGYKLYLIDNSAMLHRSYCTYGGDTFIEKGESAEVPSDQNTQFPFDRAITVSGNLHKKLPKLFGPYLSRHHIRGLSKHSELTYLIWKNTLWLRREPHMSLKVKKYYHSTLLALEQLTKEDLEQIWDEWLLVEPEHGSKLIQLTLDRRDEVGRAAYEAENIVEDVKS